MTPQQKIKWAILEKAKQFGQIIPEITPETVDAIYDKIEDDDYGLQDAREEVRSGGWVKTGLECGYSTHYEGYAVGAKMPDGSWVGWTYWYGGGKHGEPQEIDWMEDAVNLNCKEEEKMVVVRTFTKIDEATPAT